MISSPLPLGPATYYASTPRNKSRSSLQQTHSSPNSLAGNPEAKTDHRTVHVSDAKGSSPPTQPINVVLFGEAGVGKSSVVNLIAQKEVAQVSPDANGCTAKSTHYDISFGGTNFTIFDTIGFEPQMEVNSYLKAVENVYELIMKLGATGGVHLLLFCMRGAGITAATQSNYRLFCECLCNTKVPIALVITGLEKEEEMEDWWVRNKTHIEGYGIKSDGHACITTIQGSTPGDVKYIESQKKMGELLKTCALQGGTPSPGPYSWFARLGRTMRSVINKCRNLRRRDAMRVLTHRCKLDRETAEKIRSMMEKGDTETRDGNGDEQNANKEHEGKPNPGVEDKAGDMKDESRVVNGDHTTAPYDSEVEQHRQTGEEKWRESEFGKRTVAPIIQATIERLGDAALDAEQYDEAISHYSTALLISSPQTIFVKRSKAWLATGKRKEALDDAIQAIKLDPSSPWGYETKHAALHEIGEYDNAIEAFETMLSKMRDSPNLTIRQRGDEYISPSSTETTIRKIVQRTVHHLPRVLINTTTGRLHDRTEHTSAFESLPIFKELVSSTTKRIDYVRIRREVRQYFRYVVLSHRWEDNEPLFQHLTHVTVYDLDKSPTHDKLQMFCKTVQDAGFNWAWSDTCCINASDPSVHQEALVAMFGWYQRSALMIVFLRGVCRSSPRGALARSMWNTRAWTLQEYIAAKVVRFYTEDWTLYADLELPNHKESPVVASEMERATGVPAKQLMALCPGLTCIREKLRLASTRTTTRVEDSAYSLLGIFSAMGMSPIYGEGEASLGRLLANVLSRSGDVGVLAWTGEPSRFNSCFPARIDVFNGTALSHLPTPTTDPETEFTFTGLSRFPSFDLDVALTLYDRLDKLPMPWFAESRMTLPCIIFQLPSLSSTRTRSGRVYRADTPAFGDLEIRTRHDLDRMKSLYLVHPWLDALLEHEGAVVEDVGIFDEDINYDEINDDPSLLPEPDLPSVPCPPQITPSDKETRARRLVARLRQPFGALLFTTVSAGRRDGATGYKRVATDSLITVRFREDVSLKAILDNVRTIDVL